MAGTMQPQELVDSTVVDPDGSKIGKVGTVFLADDTHQPEWVTVKTGLFGTKESFVPLQGAGLESDGLHVSVRKDQVHEAPRIDTETQLSQEDSAELYRHYGMPLPRTAMDDQPSSGKRQQGSGQRSGEQTGMAGTAGAAGAAGLAGTAGVAGAAGRTGTDRTEQTSGRRSERDTREQQPKQRQAANPEQGIGERQGAAAERQQAQPRGETRRPEHEQTEQRDRAASDQWMVRSEERLNVGTEQVESGHVRLRKYVVTEEQQINVPVRHEEVRLEREPITSTEGGVTGKSSEIGEQEYEVVLHAERPVVQTEVVPVEKVRLKTDMVTEEQTISGRIRKEQFEVNDDTKQQGQAQGQGQQQAHSQSQTQQKGKQQQHRKS